MFITSGNQSQYDTQHTERAYQTMVRAFVIFSKPLHEVALFPRDEASCQFF